jgi:CBS domain-containing protein
MRCEEIMQRQIEYVSLQDTVERAAERMRDMNIGFLPVCDPGRHVLGTLTDRDVAIRIVADRRPSSTHVGDVMTREVVACRATDGVERAEQLLVERKKSRILCTDDRGRLVGIISLGDLARVASEDEVGGTLRGVKRQG